jgi:hypothetical protein
LTKKRDRARARAAAKTDRQEVVDRKPEISNQVASVEAESCQNEGGSGRRGRGPGPGPGEGLEVIDLCDSPEASVSILWVSI